MIKQGRFWVRVMFSFNELILSTGGRVVRKGNKGFFYGVSTDTRTIKEGEVFFALRGERFDGHDFVEEAVRKGAFGVVVSKPPFPENTFVLLVDDTLSALGSFARFLRDKKDAIFIGITGSSGKTTTKYILSEVLSEGYTVYKSPRNFNNLIGLPLSIFGMGNERIGVFELGISYEGEMEKLASILNPDISIITNIGPSHLSGLGSIERVLKEKLVLLKHTRKAAFIHESIDHPPLPIDVFTFSKEKVLDYTVDNVRFEFGGVRFTCGGIDFDISIPSLSGFYGSLIAIAVGKYMGLDLKTISRRLALLKPLEGRGRINTIDGIIFIDDSYNSNPLSLKSSLFNLSLYTGRKIAVIGDMLELGDDEERYHREIGVYINSINLDGLFLFGDRARWIGDEVSRDYFWTDNMEELIEGLKRFVKKGDAVLVKGSRGMRMERVIEGFKK